jgi:multidrug transporter EmrE-like cation transporter
MVLSGASLGIVLKLQNTLKIKEQPFEHPYVQLLTMFLGEHLCIYVYYFQKWQLVKQYGSEQASPGMQKAVAEGMKTNINPLILAIPMLCDCAASTLLLIAYINIPASIAQMMGGFVVFIVAIMSIIFLKRILYRHHWLGMSLIFTGICMVATTAIIYKGGADAEGNAVLGVSFMVGSILIQGVQFIVEEKLLGSYYLSPMYAVGWEGITGSIFSGFLLLIFQYIPCSVEGICNGGKVENSRFAFEQIGASSELIVLLIANIILVGAMNGLGMAVTKYASAANRVTLQQSKTVIVWIFFLIKKGGGHEKFYGLQLGGFIVMLAGVVLYNEIAAIPILGFNQYTKAAIAARSIDRKASRSESQENDVKQPLVNDTTEYTQSSPKGYDYQRNYKRLKDKMENSANTPSGNPEMKIEEN